MACSAFFVSYFNLNTVLDVTWGCCNVPATLNEDEKFSFLMPNMLFGDWV